MLPWKFSAKLWRNKARRLGRRAERQRAVLAKLNLSRTRLKKDNAELRRVLGMVEWVGDEFVHNPDHCIWCHQWEQEGHAPDCPRQEVLGETE